MKTARSALVTAAGLVALVLFVGSTAAQVVGPDGHAPKAPEAAEAAVPPTVRMLIDAIDIPLTPEALARVGVTEAHATALAADPAAKRYTRVRAVAALGVLGTDSARRLVELMATADADPQVRIQAVVSLSRIWGADDRAEVARFLTERLDDAPPRVDEAITRELARLHR